MIVSNHHYECEHAQPLEVWSHLPLEHCAACRRREGAVWEKNNEVPQQSVSGSLNITYRVKKREQEKSMRCSNKSTSAVKIHFSEKES